MKPLTNVRKQGLMYSDGGAKSIWEPSVASEHEAKSEQGENGRLYSKK